MARIRHAAGLDFKVIIMIIIIIICHAAVLDYKVIIIILVKIMIIRHAAVLPIGGSPAVLHLYPKP